MQVFEEYCLPSGLRLNNRLVKAGMEENLATAKQLPSEDIFKLYKAWANGGAGLIITGNVMVDPLAMTGPAGISLHKHSDSFTITAKISSRFHQIRQGQRECLFK